MLILLVYLQLQTGRVASDSIRFSAVNGIGALLILVSLTQSFNLSAFVIEVAWLLISVYGLLRAAKKSA
jgi:hypothetical protein